jgi:hypothetical protein
LGLEYKIWLGFAVEAFMLESIFQPNMIQHSKAMGGGMESEPSSDSILIPPPFLLSEYLPATGLPPSIRATHAAHERKRSHLPFPLANGMSRRGEQLIHRWFRKNHSQPHHSNTTKPAARITTIQETTPLSICS